MRSKLFVPGSRPELFEKAWLSEADALSFDLEDAVAASAKDQARKYVADVLDGPALGPRKTIIVRVNSLESSRFDDDINAVVRSGLDVLNMPKVESAEAVRAVSDRLASLEASRRLGKRIGLLVNIETPRGLDNVVDIASASRRIVGLQLGFGDLFSPLGIERSPISQGPVRLKVRLAAGGARVPAYDGAFVVVSNPEGFRAEAEAARAMGFAGKTCIHPSQTPIANEVFFPRQDEIEAARRVVEKADDMEAKGVDAFTVNGAMFDGPLITRARDTLRLAEERSK